MVTEIHQEDYDKYQDILLAVTVVCAFISFLLATVSFAFTFDSIENYETLIASFEEEPILDVVAVNAGSDCPAGYQSTPGLYFPGTYDMCDCTNVTLGSCETNLTDACSSSCASECTDVPGLPSRGMKSWNGKNILHYVLYENETGNCTEKDLKICGASAGSNVSTDVDIPAFCWPKDTDCPINYALIDTLVCGSNETCIELDGGTTRLHLSRVGSNYPLEHINISYTDPCWDPEGSWVQPTAPSRNTSCNVVSGPLNENCSVVREAPEGMDDGCRDAGSTQLDFKLTTNPRVMILDTQPINTFQSQNNVPSTYVTSSTSSATLYAVWETPWIGTCRYDRSEVTARNGTISDIKGLQIALFAITMFAFFVLSVYVPCKRKKLKEKDEWSKSHERNFKISKLATKAMKYILILICFSVAVTVAVFFDLLFREECSDSVGNFFVEGIAKVIDTISNNNIGNLVTGLFNSVGDTFEYIVLPFFTTIVD